MAYASRGDGVGFGVVLICFLFSLVLDSLLGCTRFMVISGLLTDLSQAKWVQSVYLSTSYGLG